MSTSHKDHPFKLKFVNGIRGNKFQKFLSCLLRFSNLKEHDKNVLLDPANIRLYEQAFTHPSIHSTFNYEYLEFLGDLTLNKSIPWVLARRFPQLCRPQGVKILSRLKIQLVSNQVFADLASRLHFLPFISSDLYTRTFTEEDLLEDVFEAFFGTTEMIMDKEFHLGVGYAVCYTMIDNFMRMIPISLRYEDLYDAKTRLKELFDVFKDTLGKIKYTFEQIERDRMIYSVTANRISPDGKTIAMGLGEHHLLRESEKIAAEHAITLLNTEGYVKTIPDFYREIAELQE